MVTVDDAIVPYDARRPADARPAALDDDRRPVRLGGGRADLGRRDELDRDPDDGGDRRRRRDADGGAAKRPRLRADRLPRRRRARRARPALAAVAAPRGARMARGVHGAHGRAADASSRSRRSARRSSCRRALPGALGGPGLVLLGVAGSYLTLLLTLAAPRRGAAERGAPLGGLALATLVAIGIGLHNLGEGLAIGSSFALGELALGTFFVIGFMVHNVTEGLGIAAPRAEDSRRASIGRLARPDADRRRAGDPRRLDRRLRDERLPRRRSSSPPRPAPRSRWSPRSAATSPARRPAELTLALRARRLPRRPRGHVRDRACWC